MIDPQRAVADLVLDHSECASVLQRHHIDYCCHGDVPLAAACDKRKLDLGAIVGELERAVSDGRGADGDVRALSNPALVAHIIARYHVPLRKSLPFLAGLAGKVARVHGEHNPRLHELAVEVAELADALDAHLDDEEARLFPAMSEGDAPRVRALEDATRGEHAAVGELRHVHLENHVLLPRFA